jgi:hypothetical protein
MPPATRRGRSTIGAQRLAGVEGGQNCAVVLVGNQGAYPGAVENSPTPARESIEPLHQRSRPGAD